MNLYVLFKKALIMRYKKGLNICQPGNNASCALCCGSHNYDAPREMIENLFMKRSAEHGKCDAETAPAGIPGIIDDAIQCSHVGFINNNGGIGCLIYGSKDRPDLRSCKMGNEICRNFFCLAGATLTDDDIAFSSKLMGDWFYYSLLIHVPEIIRELRKNYLSPEEIPGDVLLSIKEKLRFEIYGGISRQAVPSPGNDRHTGP
jgi:hypothetical protein